VHGAEGDFADAARLPAQFSPMLTAGGVGQLAVESVECEALLRIVQIDGIQACVQPVQSSGGKIDVHVQRAAQRQPGQTGQPEPAGQVAFGPEREIIAAKVQLQTVQFRIGAESERAAHMR